LFNLIDVPAPKSNMYKLCLDSRHVEWSPGVLHQSEAGVELAMIGTYE
jgi:hypothetical protein